MGESVDGNGTFEHVGGRWSSRLLGMRLVRANPALRRLALAWALFNVAEYSIVVALGVYAFAQGGTLAVGAVALTRTLPALVAGPLAAVATDRWRRGRVLILGLVGRMGVSAAIVGVLLSGQPYFVYALAALDAMLAASFWPAMAALTAEFSREPEELTAANATSSIMESLGSLLGPVAAGSLLLFGSPAAVFALGAGLFGIAAGVAFRLRSSRVPIPVSGGLRWREVTGGWRALRAVPDAGWVISLWGLESLVLGSLDVVVVVLSIEYLGLGDSGVGYLLAAGGVGGVLAAGLVSVISRQSGRLLTSGLVALGAALMVIGAVPRVAVVFLAMGVAGAAAAWVDVGAQTLLQRLVPDDRLGRVLGLFEGLYWAALGLGGLVGSALIVATSVQVGVAVIGGSLTVVGIIGGLRLRRVDLAVTIPYRRLHALRAMPVLARLPTSTLERLARRSEEMVFPEGTTIIRQGEVGDRFYVIEAGVVEVDADGEELATLGAGDGFGEIALVMRQPRNADVVSLSETRVVSVPGGEFLEAVTGHSGAAAAVESLVAARMAGRVGRHRAP